MWLRIARIATMRYAELRLLVLFRVNDDDAGDVRAPKILATVKRTTIQRALSCHNSW
jgi:hypothetical protein